MGVRVGVRVSVDECGRVWMGLSWFLLYRGVLISRLSLFVGAWNEPRADGRWWAFIGD